MYISFMFYVIFLLFEGHAIEPDEMSEINCFFESQAHAQIINDLPVLFQIKKFSKIIFQKLVTIIHIV